jgi:hypothetical protein
VIQIILSIRFEWLRESELFSDLIGFDGVLSLYGGFSRGYVCGVISLGRFYKI